MNQATAPKLTLNFRVAKTPLTGLIRFAIGASVEGTVLVARSEIGICAIFLDDDAEGLRCQLREAFPTSILEEAARDMRRDLAQVLAFIDKRAADGAIDLDIGGTSFQQRVWEALCSIPVGRTRTYAQVAECIGAPEAVRVVASACAANLHAIVVPCHRVVRGDGKITGYRWGVERKRALLQRESV